MTSTGVTVHEYWRTLGAWVLSFVILSAITFFLLRFDYQSLASQGIPRRSDLLDAIVNAIPNASIIVMARAGWRKGESNHNAMLILFLICSYICVIFLSESTLGFAFPNASPKERHFYNKWWMLVIFTAMTAFIGTIFRRPITNFIMPRPPDKRFEL